MVLETATLISFGSWLGSKIADKGFEEIYKRISTADLNKKFYKAVDNVSQKLQRKYPDVLGGSIEYFFKKDEIFGELIKLLFKNSKIDPSKISEIFDTRTLPSGFVEEFVLELRIELLKDQEFDKILSDNELFIAIVGIGQDVAVIAKNSTITTTEVSRISKILDERIGKSFDLSKFIELYSKNALNNLSQVNFIGLGIDISIKKNRKKLNDIFISPILVPFQDHSKVGKRINDDFIYDHFFKTKIGYNDLLKSAKNLVVLGDPGSGKSILVRSIICDILLKSRSTPEQFHDFIPFRIELRKYLAFKTTYNGTVTSYLKNILETEYQIPNLTTTLVQSILSQNKCIVFFDGLDEIFDVTDKIGTKNDIENFNNSYPDAFVIVTSRIIGYEEARLNEEVFNELVILQFNDRQVDEYVNKWYAKEEQNKEIRKREVKGFLDRKHEIDNELIKNPLLLSLIVIIYRNILKLPESKLEIYQSCTKTLVDKWDASKDLQIKLDPAIIRNKEKLFADLAYWQYHHLSSKSLLITYEKAKGTIAKSIQEKLKLNDEQLAEELAENFMVYAQKRSIYFENNFTHKTFLEYYTAYWIYSNFEKKHRVEERDGLISKYISNSFWFIVLELLFNLIDKDQGDTEVIDRIFVTQVKGSFDALPFLISVVPNLKNIDLGTTSTLISVSVDYLMDHKNTSDSKNSSEGLESKIFSSLKSTLNHSAIRTVLKEKLVSMERTSDNIELAANVYIFVMELARFGLQNEMEYDIYRPELYEDARTANPYLFALDIYANRYSEGGYMDKIKEFVVRFGKGGLFNNYPACFDNFTMPGFLYYFIRRQVHEISAESLLKNLSLLKELGIEEDELLHFIQRGHHQYFSEKDELRRVLSVLDLCDDDYACKFLFSVMFASFLDFRVGAKFWSDFQDSKKMQTARKILSADPETRKELVASISDFRTN
jgi:hypothetical protein